MKDIYETRWQTHDEIAFIDGIGTWRKVPSAKAIPKLVLLKRYYESVRNRVNWGEIDDVKIVRYINKAITTEERV